MPPLAAIKRNNQSETKQNHPNASPNRSSNPSLGETEQAHDVGGAADPRPTSIEANDRTIYDVGRIRLRGCALWLAGQMYPVAYFKIHRIGSHADADLEAFSVDLRRPAEDLSPDAYYRVHLAAVDLSELGKIGWGTYRWVPDEASLLPEDYINVLKLGDSAVKKWMMFVWHTDDTDVWVVSAQSEGKAYSVEDCLEVLAVPDDIRQEVEGFGPRAWTVGQSIPRCYLAKDLPLKYVETKIRELMQK